MDKALMSGVLSCRNLRVSFGDFVAVKDISLEFMPGTVTGLIGPNGAGKTTLLNILSGRLLNISQGQILWQGNDISPLSVHERTKLGIGRSFQISQTFTDFTVEENLRVARQASFFGVQPFFRSVTTYPELMKRPEEMIASLGLKDVRHVPVSELSHGYRRRLEIGLTLMGDPSCLLLDEPLAGIGHSDVRDMISIVRIAARNRTSVIIEHNMNAIMELCDRIVVLVRGEVLADGSPKDIMNSKTVKMAYLGGAGDA
jgi:branched-chain amino acid transport system ATP-binding protein